MKYTLYSKYGIECESNNKQVIIDKCRKMKIAGTVEDNMLGGIIFENKAQRRINNENV